MKATLALVPILPLAGFLLLTLRSRQMKPGLIHALATSSVTLSFLAVLGLAIPFLGDPKTGRAITVTLWQWLPPLGAGISLRLDPLSLLMALVVTGVGALIHLYAGEYMKGDEGYGRFFAAMNLFVFAMLVLVLADNLLLLYLGWEGVGLCSYLLIGFWYQDPVNGRAARKAFIVTRIGDTALAIGLFLLFQRFATLDIPTLLRRFPETYGVGNGEATLVALLLLGGALGKSAQLPLQTWLPDAMAGPTPVSALIHAATMVTAGVYLIARTHPLFMQSPTALAAVGIVGAVTLLVAGLSALAQSDIKKVLAYSTISQIGSMFLALGVSAWTAAMFHFLTHAFFKALLFLGAGAVIHALHGEQDLFSMGGLRRRLPWVYRTFLIGCLALAALPLVTAGFFSKDLILWRAWQNGGSRGLFWAALAGALVTALYTFRMLALAFYGTLGHEVEHRPGWKMTVPLLLLALGTLVLGWLETPGTLGHVTLFSRFLAPVFGAGNPSGGGDAASEGLVQLLSAGAVLAGAILALALYGRRRKRTGRWAEKPGLVGIHRILAAGFGFDRLYDLALARPLTALARRNAGDVTSGFYRALAGGVVGVHRLLSVTVAGRLRWYAAGFAGGVALLLLWVVSR